MPEIVTGIAEWRQTLADEMEALAPLPRYGRGSLPPAFKLAKTSTDLRADAKSAGHMLFTVQIEEGDMLDTFGGASVTTNYEQHEWYATIEYSWKVRPETREQDEQDCRTITRWVLHQITPGALSIGAGRRMESPPLYELVQPGGKGPEWLIVTMEIRAHVYVAMATAVVQS